MTLRPDLARTMVAIRRKHEEWALTAGETLTVSRGPHKVDGHPTLPHPCRCHTPVRDEETCARCGKGCL